MGHEKDWEMHARKSRSSAFLTLIGAIVVISSLVFSFSLLQKLKIQNEELQHQKNIIMTSRDSLQVLSYEIINLNKQIIDHAQAEHSDNADAEHEENTNLNRQFDAKIKELENLVQDIPTSRSKLESVDDLVLCRNVNKRMPESIGTSFSPGRVYAWARIYSPTNETFVLNWLDAEQNIIRTKNLAVKANMETGYRVYDYKTFRTGGKGDYGIKLYNSEGILIAKRDFQINE